MNQQPPITVVGRAVRDARGRLGWSQAALASRLGVARMTVSRLERGDDVSLGLAVSALTRCGLNLSLSARRGWLTAAEHGEAITSELAADDPDFALRLVRGAIEDLDYLLERADPTELDLFLAAPPAVPDPRWDALLRLALSRSCLDHGHDPPAWAVVEALAEPFFPGRPSPRFVARVVARSPSPFAQANVWIDPRDLSYA